MSSAHNTLLGFLHEGIITNMQIRPKLDAHLRRQVIEVQITMNYNNFTVTSGEGVSLEAACFEVLGNFDRRVLSHNRICMELVDEYEEEAKNDLELHDIVTGYFALGYDDGHIRTLSKLVLKKSCFGVVGDVDRIIAELIRRLRLINHSNPDSKL